MKKKLGNIFIIAEAIIITAICLILVYGLSAASDRKPPVITIESVDIVYSQGDADSVLLQGVTATDDKDGDVTDTIIIESTIILEDNQSIKVNYAAKDSKNNIGKSSRIVKYNPDGNHSPEGETSTDNGSNEKPTESQQSNQEQKPTQPQANQQKPVLTLKAAEVELKVGNKFNVVSYVDNITDDKDERKDLFRNIIADGKCNTEKAGDYTIWVYCSDSDKNYSEKNKLIVHVRE